MKRLRKAIPFVLAFVASTCFAGPEISSKEIPPVEPTGCIAPSDTEFRFGLPAWISGLDGDFGVGGLVTDQDLDFTDILKDLDMIVSGSLYARYHRWELFADGQYLKLSDTARLRGFLFQEANVGVKSAFAEAFLGFRAINCRTAVLSFFAGARYNYMSADIHVRGARLESVRAVGETDWIDPVIGIGGKVRVYKPISFYAKGDVGGFGVNSDLAWQVQGGFEVQLTRSMYTNIAWRYLKNDYSSGGFVNKTELNGPVLETGIDF